MIKAPTLRLEHRGDLHGWVKASDGTWSCGLLVPQEPSLVKLLRV